MTAGGSPLSLVYLWSRGRREASTGTTTLIILLGHQTSEQDRASIYTTLQNRQINIIASKTLVNPLLIVHVVNSVCASDVILVRKPRGRFAVVPRGHGSNCLSRTQVGCGNP